MHHPGQVRIATFNVSFDRPQTGQIYAEMASGEVQQIRNVAEILQRTRPDVVVLTEFDHDGNGANDQHVRDFIRHYLHRSQHGAPPIDYPWHYLAPTNSGLLAGVDLDGDGQLTLPQDGLGFGSYHGQYGFVVLSRYPLDRQRIRTFQTLRWQAMPGALLPDRQPQSGLGDYYSAEALAKLRLSSKNHVDLPVIIGNHRIHLLALHPTPPAFDGPERRNRRRNHDELRLFADYISTDSQRHHYLVDDHGHRGGLSPDASFVIAGDLNADPFDGEAWPEAVRQLLDHSRVNREAAVGKLVPVSEGARTYSCDWPHAGPAEQWTHLYPLRLDYVLPSSKLQVIASGVYWEPRGSAQRYLFENEQGEQGKAVSSDHRLVWVDILLELQNSTPENR